MRFSVLVAIMLLFPVGMQGAEPQERSESEPNTIHFQDESYRLSWVHEHQGKNHREIINEYVRPAETLEKWTRLMSVRLFPQRRDYRQMAGGLVEALRQQNPLAKFAIMENPERTRTMVDFVTWDLDKAITEFNIFIYQLDATGNGVLAQQFAMRAYGKEEGFDFLRKLKELRPQLLTDVTQFDFPAITTRQP